MDGLYRNPTDGFYRNPIDGFYRNSISYRNPISYQNQGYDDLLRKEMTLNSLTSSQPGNSGLPTTNAATLAGATAGTIENVSDAWTLELVVSKLRLALNTLMLLVWIGLLVAVVLSLYALWRQANPSTSHHICASCHSEFQCRERKAPHIDKSGGIVEGDPKKKSNKSPNQGMHGFRRHTVKVGSFPVDIATPTAMKICCATQDERHQHYCSYPCYHKLIAI